MSSTTAIAPAPVSLDAKTLETALIGGDLAKLTPAQRLAFYDSVCRSLNLNPLTKPFEYIELSDNKGGTKLTLYARRDCTDQLRKNNDVSVQIVSRELVDGVYIVTARATMPSGRTDEAVGAVAFAKEGGAWKTASSGKRYFEGNGTFSPLSPEDRANAAMRAETKSKRRVTLSICGLGWTDESETDGMSHARIVNVDVTTGEILDSAPPALPTPTPTPDVEASITREQFDELLALAVKSGWKEDEFKSWLKQAGYASAKAIPASQYAGLKERAEMGAEFK